MTAVAKNAHRAIQFWGSAMVKVPNGGRKKKLKARVEYTARNAAYQKPHLAETTRTANKKVRATVVTLACGPCL
jgi:hypothetical protein